MYAVVDETGSIAIDDLEAIDAAVSRVFLGERVAITQLLGRGKSTTQGARVYLGHRLNAAGARTGSMCAIKFGPQESIQSDYANWRRYIAPRPPTMLHPSTDPVLIMAFLGEDYKLLSDLSAGSGLSAIVSATLDSWLDPLHRYSQSATTGMPTRAVLQRDLLYASSRESGARIAEKDRLLVAERLGQEMEDAWTAETLTDNERGLSVRNWIPRLVNDESTLGSDYACAEPLGIIHGDPNFDNIFVEVTRGEVTSEPNVILIDFERCREGSPYDDLARIECELLFSALALETTPRRGSDTDLISAVYSMSWGLAEGIPLGISSAESEVYAATRLVRQQAIRYARSTYAEFAALERCYFGCLMARVFSYLHYGIHPEARPRVLEACSLLAERLSRSSLEAPTVRFLSTLGTTDGSKPNCDDKGYLLRPTAKAATAMLMISANEPNASAVALDCEFVLSELGNDVCAAAITTGAFHSDPLNTGTRISILRTLERWQLVVSRVDAADPSVSRPLPGHWNPIGRPVKLRVRQSRTTVEAILGVADESIDCTLTVRTGEPLAQVSLSVSGCSAVVTSARFLRL